MDLSAKITGIKYAPFLCKKLETFDIKDLDKTLSSKAVFILKINEENQFAVSWWVSAKRTRSYPYARVYDSLGFGGKKITIIPIMKDEGKRGDRDFLQWDTVSLMSLLGVHVIIGYYTKAERSKRYRHKITNQRFDIDYIKSEIEKLLSYQSDALHWNLAQADKAGEIGQKALEAYTKTSEKLKVDMHSKSSAEKRIAELLKGREKFIPASRGLAEKAQKRERMIIQPKERVSGVKAIITIKNYLGGYYYFTSDEVEVSGKNIRLIEAKHSRTNTLPSLEDIKDGLLRMFLFTNLKDLKIDSKNYRPTPVLKLTVEDGFNANNLSKSQKETLELLKKEAKTNGFRVVIE